MLIFFEFLVEILLNLVKLPHYYMNCLLILHLVSINHILKVSDQVHVFMICFQELALCICQETI